MTLEQTLDSTNNINIATNHNMAGWSTAQKMTMDVQHSARNDKKAEIEYSNAINQQNLSNHSALDELNNQRTFNRIIMGSIANKLINVDAEEAVAADALFQGKANASVLSLLSQLGAGQIGGKIAMTTPPESGVTQLMAQLNALNAQNHQNQAATAALANSLTSANAAIAAILTKNAYNVPPVGTAPSPQPVQI